MSLQIIVPGMRAIILYTNHRGERMDRNILPHSIWFGSTQWHPDPQWMLRAWVDDRGDGPCGDLRDFAMGRIESWRPA